MFLVVSSFFPFSFFQPPLSLLLLFFHLQNQSATQTNAQTSTHKQGYRVLAAASRKLLAGYRTHHLVFERGCRHSAMVIVPSPFARFAGAISPFAADLHLTFFFLPKIPTFLLKEKEKLKATENLNFAMDL